MVRLSKQATASLPIHLFQFASQFHLSNSRQVTFVTKGGMRVQEGVEKTNIKKTEVPKIRKETNNKQQATMENPKHSKSNNKKNNNQKEKQ